MKFNKLIIFVFLHSLLPIALGAGIYLTVRTDWFLDPNNFPQISLPNNHATDVLIYSLPDGLWLYSFLSTIEAIWTSGSPLPRLTWQMFIICSAIVTEFLQKHNLLNGTYDNFDIGAYLLASIPFIFKFIHLVNQKTNSL